MPFAALDAAPTPVDTNEPFSMFALWPGDVSQALTTDCAVV